MRRFALNVALALNSVGAAFAQMQAPNVDSPFTTLAGVESRPSLPPALPPRADGVPADLAFGAYQRGNFLYALLEAERRLDANPKDAAAMTLIGEIYHDGAAVVADDREASRWYRLASNLGDPRAAYELGVLLLQGAKSVPKDPVAARALFERAAAKDNSSALYNLGIMELNGVDGKTPDYAKAAQYFFRAAKAGDDNAAYSYGVMLREGKGVPQDIVEAAHWLKRAADGGIIAGQVEYAIMLFNGDGIPRDEGAAAKILLVAAARGNPIAQNRIAHLYAAGRALPRDLAKAAAWNSFAKAAGLQDQDLDVATANLTLDERRRFTRMVHEVGGF
ncbi:MAG TPA: tetratricopeptide repeat protein [Roseiarcus sp.]|nr:tetratricopeptide repeat protein [Roseiarcus sp.]